MREREADRSQIEFTKRRLLQKENFSRERERERERKKERDREREREWGETDCK